MADHHHHHQHRPHRLSVPLRTDNPSSLPSTTTTITTPRVYPPFPSYNASTPIPTPSKHRLSSSSSLSSSSLNNKSTSLSFLFILLFSLRSLYSLLPFLRSSPSSFSLFPFSFLVSLLSFLLTLSFSLLSPSSSSRKDPFQHKPNQPIFSLSSITPSQHKLILFKSLLLAIIFLLRFQALRYCGTSAMILAELSGNVAAQFVASDRVGNKNKSTKVRGLIALLVGLFLLSISWDRIDCFPLSSSNGVFLREGCVRVFPMLLPFMSGFLGCYERISMNWGSIRQLGQKRIRLISLFFTTVLLFIPAVISIIVFEAEGDSISIRNLGWPLANTVVFGVLLSENFSDDKIVSSKDFRREFLVTFVCTIVLELFYFPELSLWGLLLCGLFLWIAVRELDPVRNYVELGLDSSESFTSLIMKPIRHILSERKSRKIALFLLINTAYMVVEFVAGFMSNSLGLISDACHMLFDCAALAIGLYASYISRLPANSQFNYGRGRFEVLSGYVNAVFLVLVGVLIVLESFERILDPQEISTNSLLTVSIGGLVVNIVGLIFFHEEHHHAHGGSGSCTHSHSHSKSHAHHHHSHDHYEHRDCEHHGQINNCADEPKKDRMKCSDHDHHHHDHDHHDHVHHHDRHDSHNHHEHHHHEHEHVNHHLHGSIPIGSSGSLHSHHSEGHTGGEIRLQGGSQTNSHSSDFRSSSINSVSQLSKLSSDGRLFEEPKKHHHHHIDHNMEGIFLHVLADTMGSVGVVISTLLIKYKGWLAADPACSIFISILVVSSVIPLLRNSAEILLQRVPRAHEQDIREAVDDVKKLKGVRGIQNLHVWSFTNTDVVGTLHLHVSTDTDKASIREDVSHMLHDAGIKDLTLQLECVNSN